MSKPRLVAIMGSGETSPTMTTVHRDLYDRVGGPGVVLDTPVGFQLNADELAARAIEYFERSVQRPVTVASLRDPARMPALERERGLRALREAAYVFAGPGSPTYALRAWRDTPVPDLLRDKLRTGGCITFASAAALTLGAFTVPVYEIYKVGETPRWERGLDLLAEAGLEVACIPHYNNAEGGTHDTRYCYMGERRLRMLEAEMPEDAFILGVDEHTACVIDLDARTVAVAGIGAVTVRRNGAEHRLESGTELSLDELIRRGRGEGLTETDHAFAVPAPTPRDAPAGSPFWDGVESRAAAFDSALEAGRVDDAVGALLELYDHLWKWSTETFGTGEMERAKQLAAEMIVRLGEHAAAGPKDVRAVVAPFVRVCLDVRAGARAARRYDEADAIRAALEEAGVEVQDTPEGTLWSLRE